MSAEDRVRQSSIWLEVANVRLDSKKVEIQVKGDRADREPVWREVKMEEKQESPPPTPDYNTTYRTIAEGLDKKRVVLAMLEASNGTLKCTHIRVQYAESNSR